MNIKYIKYIPEYIVPLTTGIADVVAHIPVNEDEIIERHSQSSTRSMSCRLEENWIDLYRQIIKKLEVIYSGNICGGDY